MTVDDFVYEWYMNCFPLDIVHRILEYDGRFKYRNGKFMNQIAHDDDRYKMLQTMHQILSNPSNTDDWYMTIALSNNNVFIHKIGTISTRDMNTKLSFQRYNFTVCEYRFVKQGMLYTWVIYKTSPSICIVSVLQYLYHLCWVLGTWVLFFMS